MKKMLLLAVILALCACSSVPKVEQEEPVPSITAALENALILVIPYQAEEIIPETEDIHEPVLNPDVLSNQFLFIEGYAENDELLEAFLWAFQIEAGGAGYIVVPAKEDAAYTFKFDVSANMIEDNKGNLIPALENDNQYIVRISLIDNSNNEEILFFDFFFTEIDEVYEYSQSLFNMATVYIPPGKRDIYYDYIVDRDWQNKWLYLRASVDYPISFFALQPTGLLGGQAAYMPSNSPTGLPPLSMQRLNHIILPQPGLTIGVEGQFLDFLGAELGLKMNIGDPWTYSFFNLTLNMAVKYNIKTENFMIQPYIGGLIPLIISDVFIEFPPLSLGAGVQAGVKGGPSGMIFIDVSFMYSFGEVYMKNQYAEPDKEGKTIAPVPRQIHYKHFVFGISVGYKYGLFNR